MLTVFQDYNAIRANIANILLASGYKSEYVARKLGLTPQNFATKKQRNSFTTGELQKIIELVTAPNEDAEDAIMLEIMRSRINEKAISFEEYKVEIASWK